MPSFTSVLQIEESEVEKLNKFQWKCLIRDRLKCKDKEDILERMKKSKKFSYFSHKDEDYKIRSYFETMNLHECRTMFGLRSMMTQTIKSHQMNNKSYANKLWQCECGAIDSISHVKRCKVFGNLRESLDIENNDKDLVKYFQEVIKIRNETQSE